jgi:orotate phosphoribosyltransferase-like protein
MFASITLKRRALIDAQFRREKLDAENILIKDSICPHFAGSDSLNVLVLDDVLTSGGALKREWTDLRAAMQSKCNVQLHALTLFRTPAASFEEGNVN